MTVSASPAVDGLLCLIVGPSGAGKDTLIDRARAALAPAGGHVFVRRVITRPAGSGGEDHLAETPDGFARRAAAGDFLLHWQAHGLCYGIPAAIDRDRAAGRIVVANVSRAVIDQARREAAPVRIVVVDAPDAVLAARLAARGREDAADIRARLMRARATMPVGPDVVVVDNGGDLDQATAAFIRAIGG
ncbi:phosphonate metabolism protein/1,5-bisphosphokinase (PRPP-forming) PhnN [Tistrella bauzanensis]|uniref:phosphonate metabolism protein/1,5-bisphosphokinase (PRPP-forming) PhnN n=1 Tax=Tistrella TaxID=171436 RepID=UPI0031F6549C